MPKIHLMPSVQQLHRWVYLWILVFLTALTFSTALVEISSVAALGGWILLRMSQREPWPFERKIFITLLAFVFLSVISFFWSEFPRQSFRGVFKVLKQFAIFCLVTDTLRSPRRQQITFWVLVSCFIYLGIDGMWQYVFGADLVRKIGFEFSSAGPRISASFKNYGLLASYVVSFLPLLIARLEKQGKTGSLLALASGIAFGLLLLFWTRLRGAWVAFLGGLMFFLWLAKKKLYLVFLVLTLLGAFFLLPRGMVIHLNQWGKEQSLVERFYLWDRALKVIVARPWTGTGINTYTVAHLKYDRRKNWRVRSYYAHNGYLQMAAETGLPTLACFLAFLFFYFKNAFRFLRSSSEEIEKKTLVGVLTGMVSFLILGSVDTVFHNPAAIMGFWLLAGWGGALTSSPRD